MHDERTSIAMAWYEMEHLRVVTSYETVSSWKLYYTFLNQHSQCLLLSCVHVSITAFVKTFSGLQSIENKKTDSCEKMHLQIGKLIMAWAVMKLMICGNKLISTNKLISRII